MAVTTKAVPDAAGTVSVTSHYVATGTAADVLIKSPPPPPPEPTDAGNPAVPPPLEPSTSITYAIPTSTADIGIDGLHTKELLDLWALLVAHPNHDSLVAAQEDSARDLAGRSAGAERPSRDGSRSTRCP